MTLYALANVARCGASRCGYVSPKVFVSVNGTQRAFGRSDEDARILLESIRVRETNGSDPNQCNFRAMGFPVTRFDEVVVTLGTINTFNKRFAGVVLTTKDGYETSPGLPHTDVGAVDYSWQLNRVFVTGLFVGSATDILIELLETYAPDFSTSKIPTDLPTITISFTKERLRTCIDRVMKRIGGYWKADYRKRLLVTLTTFQAETDPVTLTDSLGTLRKSPSSFGVTRDAGQQITRVRFEGGGANAAAMIAPGETILPLTAAEDFHYGDEGGEVIVPESQNTLTYTDRVEGGVGGLVGPGASPSSLVTLSGLFGTALDADAEYLYGYTFVTGSGESLISPLNRFDTSTPVTPPTASWTATAHTGTPIFGTGVYVYGVSWEFPGTLRSTIGSFEAVLVNSGATDRVDLSNIPQPSDGSATGINIWRSELGGYIGGDPTSVKLVTTLGVGTTTYSDTTLDGALGVAGHTAATALCRKVRITNIAAGQNGVVTQRKVYRTVGDGVDPKLLTTIADNTTSTYDDTTADGSLGADDPAADTSGLTQASGTVSAGATSIPVNGGDWPDAGWAVVNGNYIRYTGRTAANLTGVPASGDGSLAGPVAYNTPITPAPCLTGIPASGEGSIVNTIPKGAAVNLYVKADNLLAQAELSALLDPLDELGGAAGIIEETLSDQRVNRDEAIERAQAYLDLQDDEQVTITGLSTDRNFRATRSLSANLASPEVVESGLKVQDVTATFDNLMPLFQFTASNRRYTLEDLLRRLKETA